MTKDNIYIIISKNIKKYRKLKGMTQKELAIKSGYSYTHIRQLEGPNSPKHFSIETVYNLSKALNINIKQLFEKDII